MADDAAFVKMRLTFWHKGKQPGDTVEVRREDVPSWRGFAVLVDPVVDETVKADDATAPAKTTAAAGKAK